MLLGNRWRRLWWGVNSLAAPAGAAEVKPVVRDAAIREIDLFKIPGIEFALVDIDGNVYSKNPKNKWRGKLRKLTPRDNGRGYLRVHCCGKLRCIHLLMAVTFLGEKPSGMEVNHKDGNKKNNRPENLEYVTRSYNMKHAFESGLASAKKGEENWKGRLTKSEVLRLRGIKKQEGNLKGAEIRKVAETLGVTKSAVYSAISGKRSWAWLR